MKSAELPIVFVALAVIVVGCGTGGTASSTSSSPRVSSSVGIMSSPGVLPTVRPPDAAAADAVALDLYNGGGDASTGRYDCLTHASTCPVTQRLRDRFHAFAGSSKEKNVGAGSADPICRVCEAPFTDVRVVSTSISASTVTVVVDIIFGADAVPLTVVETGSGSDIAVGDILCMKNGQALEQSSLYLVARPAC